MNDPIPTTQTAEAPLPLAVHDGQLVHLSTDRIAVQEGFNPRRYFDEAEFRERVESVRREGVLQAVRVRPVEDFDPESPRFRLIAGERRLRAAREAGRKSLPATVRLVDERQALILADPENNPQLRIGLSVAEEARFARRFVGECEGDRDEAARLLGWSRAKLDARLLLLHASESVLDALTARKIKTGHAELLAGLPAATRDGTLAKIVSERISVAELKTRIQGFALALSAAIFDKSDCAQCPHNSSVQGALFAEALDQGRCQNRGCYAEKTRAALEARKVTLQSEYATVFVDTERAAETCTVLSKGGPQGVGEAQFTACQGCRHFAAMLSTQPGREGVVQAPLCVNLACHREKVAAARPPTPPSPVGATPGVSPAKTHQGSPEKNAGAAATPKRVEVWIDGWFRQVTAEALADRPKLCRAWLLGALYREAGCPREVLSAAGVDLGTSDAYRELIPRCYALSAEAKQQLVLALLRHLVGNKPDEFGLDPGKGGLVQAAVASVAVAKVDVAAAFTPDAGFWQTPTKAGIESLLREAKSPSGESFADWYAREHAASKTDRKAFERLVKGKLSDLIDTVGNTAFDFSAWVPEAIRRRLRAVKVRA